ncbi:MAG: glycosyltransferase [Deltaproteobacteria bacterium]|nr:glycosyltransferase [Deltaproteobacteria bacterium]
MKNTLKKITPIYQINAAVKARRTKARYRKVSGAYADRARHADLSYTVSGCAELFGQRLAARNIRFDFAGSDKPAVLWVGSDEDQDTGGFLQSLKAFGNVNCFTGSDGSYGHYFNGRGIYAEKIRTENGRRLLEIVRAIKKEQNLTLVIGQMWGRTMPWRVLKEIQGMGIITVNVAMDDRHSFKGIRYNNDWMGSLGLINGLDLVLTAAPEACLWYAVEGCPALFWPEAGDPAIFHPMDVSKKHNVCFVGACYGIRKQIVQALQKRGISVTCYGSGWPAGKIATQDIPELFAASKIILGVGTIGHCTDFYSLKQRDFEATLSGSMYLTHANADLNELFAMDTDIVCYATAEECADKCEHFLRHDAARESIARSGLQRSLREHTWQKRFELLFSFLGSEEND